MLSSWHRAAFWETVGKDGRSGPRLARARRPSPIVGWSVTFQRGYIWRTSIDFKICADFTSEIDGEDFGTTFKWGLQWLVVNSLEN
jgi:hypothetical protein